MLAEHLELIEAIGLNLFFIFIFGFIGLTIHGVMNENNVPRNGKLIVYFVLFLKFCIYFTRTPNRKNPIEISRF